MVSERGLRGGCWKGWGRLPGKALCFDAADGTHYIYTAYRETGSPLEGRLPQQDFAR